MNNEIESIKNQENESINKSQTDSQDQTHFFDLIKKSKSFKNLIQSIQFFDKTFSLNPTIYLRGGSEGVEINIGVNQTQSSSIENLFEIKFFEFLSIIEKLSDLELTVKVLESLEKTKGIQRRLDFLYDEYNSTLKSLNLIKN